MVTTCKIAESWLWMRIRLNKQTSRQDKNSSLSQGGLSQSSFRLDHQPQLVNSPHGGEDRDQLVLEAVPGDPVAVNLSPLVRLRSTPVWRWSSVDPLSMFLDYVVPSPLLQPEQPPGYVLLVQVESTRRHSLC